MNEKKSMEYTLKDMTIALEKYASMVEYSKNGDVLEKSAKEVAKKLLSANKDMFYEVPAQMAKLQKSSKSEGFDALLVAINDLATYEEKNMGLNADDTDSVQLTVKTSGADVLTIETILALQKPNKNSNGSEGIIFADGENTTENVTISEKTKFKVSELTVKEIIEEIKAEDTGVVGFNIMDTEYIFKEASLADIKEAINKDQDSFEAKEQTIAVSEFGVNSFKIKLNLELI
jgi:hypothetical protein